MVLEGPPTSPSESAEPTAVPAAAGSAGPGPALPAAPAPLRNATPARALHVVVLGDSLSDPRVHGGRYLTKLLQACPNARLDNLAKGGFMVNQMRRRFENEVLPLLPGDYTHVVVFGGVNDLYSDETAGRTVSKISADLTRIYRAAKAQGLVVIAITVSPWGGFSKWYNERRARATLELNAWIAQQQREGLVDHIVDAHGLLSCGDPERLCPEYEPPFHDGIHFGRLGQDRLGQVLLETAFAGCR
jgi:lysophospholipase L1-like esterase